VAAITRVPSRAAITAIASDSSMVCAPSSTPYNMCECRSIMAMYDHLCNLWMIAL
jgi:hypothetical protein